jgi:hypothetical protein
MKKKTFPWKFDAMFGLMVGLSEYDYWMHDNDYY